MKIKQIEQISDAEVNVTWENGDVQNLQGQSAVTLLQMTEMKVGEKYYDNNSLVEVVGLTEEGVVLKFADNAEEKFATALYEFCDELSFIRAEEVLKTTNTVKERVETELDELSLKCRKLEAFVISPKFTELGYAQQYLLENQLGAMLDYEKCLKARLDCWDK